MVTAVFSRISKPKAFAPSTIQSSPFGYRNDRNRTIRFTFEYGSIQKPGSTPDAVRRSTIHQIGCPRMTRRQYRLPTRSGMGIRRSR